MVICMVNDNFYRSSGAAIAIKRIAQSLTGVEVYVAGCDHPKLKEDLTWIPEGRYRQFSLKSSNPFRLAIELVRFKQWFRRQRCDLAHCHHRRVAALLQLAGIPVLYTGQLAFPAELWFRLLRPKWMTAITPSVANNILEGTGREVLACIGNPTAFPPNPPSFDVEGVKLSAVCVGRLEPIKGHAHLLAAWRVLRDRGYRYHLHLVGEGSLRAELEAQCIRDGIEHLVHFRGYTSDVSEIVDECLFAILVSQNEGQGIVTLEAAARGRASLLTAVPGSIDLIPPYRTLPNGLPFGDVNALADALVHWFSSPDATIREGRLFFDFLKNSSDPGTIAREYQAVYHELIQKIA